MSLLTTASQTVGPFVAIGFEKTVADDLTRTGVIGEKVTIRGRVVDGDGKPVADAVVETWQADAEGNYADPEIARAGTFHGFGRLLPDSNGAFALTTIKPGRVAGPGGALQAPHIVAMIFMRGLLKHLVTRIYFPGEASNAEDPILKLVPPQRRSTLIATTLGASPNALEWNVVLQGDQETVFFDY